MTEPVSILRPTSAPFAAARKPAATILHAKSQNMACAKRLVSSQGRTLSKRLTRAPTLAAASEMTHAGRCSLSPALRQRERLESSAGRAQSLNTLIAVRMAAEVPTKNREACRGLCPISPVAAARTRAAATSADIVSP